MIVFVLPVGLTELRLRSDAAYARGLEAFAEAVRSALGAHGGYEMKENGGAFMCAFAHSYARAALAFGADVHARLAVATGKVLRCQIGMHGGDVTIEPHPSTGRMDAFGPACNRAARLAKAANPGQTLVDAATAAPLADAMPLYDLGEHGFRGLDDTVRVLQVGEGFFPPIRSQSYANDLLEFDYLPMNLVARARASLGLLDAFGVESLPSGLGRPQIEAALATAVAAREKHQASTRIVPVTDAPSSGTTRTP